MPFFHTHADLMALLGTFHPNIVTCDRLGVEVPLFGEYVADEVLGDTENNDVFRRLRQRLAVWPRAAMVDSPPDRA